VAQGMPKQGAIARFSFALRLSSLSAAGNFQSRFPTPSVKRPIVTSGGWTRNVASLFQEVFTRYLCGCNAAHRVSKERISAWRHSRLR
jgi:hypothetical protein